MKVKQWMGKGGNDASPESLLNNHYVQILLPFLTHVCMKIGNVSRDNF